MHEPPDLQPRVRASLAAKAYSERRTTVPEQESQDHAMKASFDVVDASLGTFVVFGDRDLGIIGD